MRARACQGGVCVRALDFASTRASPWACAGAHPAPAHIQGQRNAARERRGDGERLHHCTRAPASRGSDRGRAGASERARGSGGESDLANETEVPPYFKTTNFLSFLFWTTPSSEPGLPLPVPAERESATGIRAAPALAHGRGHAGVCTHTRWWPGPGPRARPAGWRAARR